MSSLNPPNVCKYGHTWSVWVLDLEGKVRDGAPFWALAHRIYQVQLHASLQCTAGGLELAQPKPRGQARPNCGAAHEPLGGERTNCSSMGFLGAQLRAETP